MYKNIYEELDAMIESCGVSNDNSDTVYTEAVVGLKPWKEYIGEFRNGFKKHWQLAMDAEKNDNKSKFNSEIDECAKICHECRAKVDSLEENEILNVVIPLLMGPVFFIQKCILTFVPGAESTKQKTIGNTSKMMVMSLISAAEKNVASCKEEYDARRALKKKKDRDLKVAKESVDFGDIVTAYVTECGAITTDEINELYSLYSEGLDEADEGDKDIDEVDDDDDFDDELSSKAEKIKEFCDKLSDEDKEKFQEIISENTTDDTSDAAFIAISELAIETICGEMFAESYDDGE